MLVMLDERNALEAHPHIPGGLLGVQEFYACWAPLPQSFTTAVLLEEPQQIFVLLFRDGDGEHTQHLPSQAWRTHTTFRPCFP